MKKSILLSFLFVGLFAFASCNGTSGNKQAAASETAQTDKAQSGTIHLTRAEFLTKVADYEKNPNEWKYLGNRPAIIDFYADWCGPCKMIAPSLEQLAKEYAGQINIYKVDVDKETELAQAFGIQGIPALLYIPMEGKPQMLQGAMPKDQLKEKIESILLKK